jgi:hypothetical protein
MCGEDLFESFEKRQQVLARFERADKKQKIIFNSPNAS